MAHSLERTTLSAEGRGWLTQQIAMLYPGSFALVMATGIISNALFLEDHLPISNALFAINAIAFPWLVVATVVRALRCGRALWADLINPRLVFSFFTIVAASDVFGIGLNLRGLGRSRSCSGFSPSRCGSASFISASACSPSSTPRTAPTSCTAAG
jgi:voltage-gated anion channel